MVQNSADVSPKRRGRPPAYDRKAVLGSMRDVFWHKGYAATSLDDLCAAADMNRPSLYNAFGEKSEVFKAVLDDYVGDIRPIYMAAFHTEGTLKDTLMAVFDASMEIYYVRTHGLGCFLMAAALTDSVRDPRVAHMVMDRIRELNEAYARLMQRAQARGELSAKADAEALGMMAFSVQNSISVRIRAGERLENLRGFVERMADVICAT